MGTKYKKTKYRKNASKSASGGNRWYVSGKTGSNPIKNNKAPNRSKQGGTLPRPEKVMWKGNMVSITKRDAELKEELDKRKDVANLDTSPKELLMPEKTSDPLATLDINQINKDRRIAAQEFGGIGRQTKEVTNFMSDDEWNMLTKEEQDNLNKKWSDRNTEYFATERGAKGNIFDGTLEERDEELRRLQAGD
tara:strand:+ start:66 stop:644 length:579 start_codon:yes stop_codon:yes gene_type:complete